MAVPKRKVSKARKRMRRAHQALTTPPKSICPNCGEFKRPHHVCPSCGMYNGKKIVEVKEL